MVSEHNYLYHHHVITSNFRMMCTLLTFAVLMVAFCVTHGELQSGQPNVCQETETLV